jgi:hypothetical protein
MKFKGKIYLFLILVILAGFFYLSYFGGETDYAKSDQNTAKVAKAEVKEEKPVITHIKTPEPLKGVYMTACIASLPKAREKMVDLIGSTELNALVIDIKDYSGTVSFVTGNPEVDAIVGSGCKVADMKEFLQELHEKDIYVIGRVTVFQDPLYTKLHPEVAVKRKDNGAVWKDRKGLAFVDVGAKQYWDHVVALAESSYEAGFDEINFDYIRFPSDGDMANADFTFDVGKTKRQAVREFFEYLSSKLSGTGMKTSADIFGMTTTNTDDLGIGQVLEYALENFDYVAPMVYPSHYPPNFNGWPDPNKVPYEIVKYAMTSAVNRDKLLLAEVSTSTPNLELMKRVNPLQLRPWLQDNDYPVSYTAAMIRAQMQATYDSGLTSWMLWDPANTYTKEALVPEV